MPYLAGGMLRLFVKLVEGSLRSLLIPSLFKSSGITWLREQQFDEPPTPQPVNYSGALADQRDALELKLKLVRFDSAGDAPGRVPACFIGRAAGGRGEPESFPVSGGTCFFSIHDL